MSTEPTATEQANAALLLEQNIDLRVIQAMARKLQSFKPEDREAVAAFIAALTAHLSNDGLFQSTIRSIVKARL